MKRLLFFPLPVLLVRLLATILLALSVGSLIKSPHLPLTIRAPSRDLAFLLISIYLFWRTASSQRIRIQNLLVLRDSFSPEIFGPRFFTGERARVATRLREIFDRHYPLNPTKILPSDRLHQDLGFGGRRCRAFQAFRQEIEREFNLPLPPGDLVKLRTFKDWVEAVVEREGRPLTLEPPP